MEILIMNIKSRDGYGKKLKEGLWFSLGGIIEGD